MLRATQEPKSNWANARRLTSLSNGPRSMGLDIGRIAPPTGYKDSRSWASSGTVMRLQEFMFRHVGNGFMPITVNGAPLAIWRLEQHYVSIFRSVAGQPAAERARVFDDATRDFATEGLGLWHFPDVVLRRARIAHSWPDGSRDGLVRPVRTLTHLLLGSPEFLQR